MSPIDTPTDGAVPVEAEPIETLVEGQVGLCTQIILPERGVFVLLPVPALVEDTSVQVGYLAVWRDAVKGEIFIFARPLHDETELGQSIINLDRDQDVPIETLSLETATLSRSVTAGELAALDVTPWQPLTRQLLWQLMGYEWTPDDGEDESLGTVAVDCDADASGDPGEIDCNKVIDVPETLYEDVIAVVCGPGCTGPCCGSNDPCCGSTNPCCGIPQPPIADCRRYNCTSSGSWTPIGWPGPCTTDNNACTEDVCDGMTCTHVPIYNACCGPNSPRGTCDDLDICTEDDLCNNGAVNNCPGQPWGTCCGTLRQDCPQDSNPCTKDYCKSHIGCIHEALNGTACGSDGIQCTSDNCYFGECHSGIPLNYSFCETDNNVCTTDRCYGGECTHPPGNDGGVCTPADNNVCTNDVCSDGQCIYPRKCPTGYTCSGPNGDCNPPGPACGGINCAFGTYCCPAGPTGGPGICCPTGLTCCGNPPGMMCCASTTCCDDGKACTTDTCPASGCTHTPVTGGTACEGDGDPCTEDKCSGDGTCFHVPMGCDDADACTTDSCNGGACVHEQIDCDDGDDCTDDACLNGQCEHTPSCGACCSKNTGVCENKVQNDCTGVDKYFSGVGVPCTPNPCCVVENSGAFDPNSVTIAQVAPSVGYPTPCTSGRTWPESLEIGISARCDGTQWCAELASVRANYSLQVRLPTGFSQVLPLPGGNTTATNYCNQIADLLLLGNFCGRPGWWMLEATTAHENVHLSRILPTTQGEAPGIETSIEVVCVVHTPGKTKLAALNEIANGQGFQNLFNTLSQNWRNALNQAVSNDHASGGPTEQAEHAVVDPVVLGLCERGEDECWPPCAACPARSTGSCCDLTTGACSVVEQCTCLGAGGWYHGDNSSCGPPSPCEGACCLSPTQCSLTTPLNCTGVFHGTGSVCAPNPCGP